MIWIISTILLYLIISAAALLLICGGEETNDPYYDIRNILTALAWPVVLMGSWLVWIAKKLVGKREVVK